MPIRPPTEVPKTSADLDKSQLDADVAHENNIRYYLDNTELGVVDEEQQAIEALLRATKKIGIQLTATDTFFREQRQLSSGVKGIGRVQGKEIITAGAFPMSLLFGEQKTGWIDSIKGLFSRGSANNPPPQQGSR